MARFQVFALAFLHLLNSVSPAIGEDMTAKCDDLDQKCEVMLADFTDAQAVTQIIAKTVCPWLHGVFHGSKPGCMANEPCCCCDVVFTTKVNAALKSKMGNFLEDSCKESPLQCDPEFDCSSCEGGSPCSENPPSTVIAHVNIGGSHCNMTESGEKCSNFTCQGNFVPYGSATCSNGEWDSGDGKCLAPCQSNPSITHIDSSKTTCSGTKSGDSCEFKCEDGFSATGAAMCNDGSWERGPRCNKNDWCSRRIKSPRPIYEPRLKKIGSSSFTEKRKGTTCAIDDLTLVLKMPQDAATSIASCASACFNKRAPATPPNWLDLEFEAHGFSLGKSCTCHRLQSDDCIIGQNYEEDVSSGQYDFNYAPANYTDNAFKFVYLHQELDAYPFEKFGKESERPNPPLVKRRDPGDTVTTLGRCEGDCDDDSDCAGHLKCFHRTSRHNKYVPGCAHNTSDLFSDGGHLNMINGDIEDPNHHEGALPFKDTHTDYCYDPIASMQYRCRQDLDKMATTMDDFLYYGQTCVLDTAVVVPACTHLRLTGQAAEGSKGGGEAIISGNHNTNLFNVNGKLTLKNLVLEKGSGFFAGALHVRGLFSLAHLIDTNIRDCKTKPVYQYPPDMAYKIGGGAVFLHQGNQHLFEHDINDGVRLILEGRINITGNSAPNGGGISSVGSSIEVRPGSTGKSMSVINHNRAVLSLPYLEKYGYKTKAAGLGGGISLHEAGGINVINGSTLHIENNIAEYGGGGIILQVFETRSRGNTPVSIKGMSIVDGSKLVLRGNKAWTQGGGLFVDLNNLWKVCGKDRQPLLRMDSKGEVDISNNLAAQGAGIFFRAGVSEELEAMVSNGVTESCPREHEHQRYSAVVSGGARLTIRSNSVRNIPALMPHMGFPEPLQEFWLSTQNDQFDAYAEEIYGGGMYFAKSRLFVKGTGSTVEIKSNKAEFWGAGFVLDGSVVQIEDGGMLTSSLNGITTRQFGGGGVLLASVLRARGRGSKIIFEKNSAQREGGGLMTSGGSGSEISILEGSRLEVFGNSAENGGGISINSKSTLTSDNTSSILFESNTATHSDGGGIASRGGSLVRLHGPSYFLGNLALNGSGGAAAAIITKTDTTNCVSIKITIVLVNKEANPLARSGVRVSIMPAFLNFVVDAQWLTKERKWKDGKIDMSQLKESEFTESREVCVTCGEVFRISFTPLKSDEVLFERGSYASISYLLPIGADNSEQTEINRVDLSKDLRIYSEFTVDCSESGFFVHDSVFEKNKATRGGAVASVGRQNVLFSMHNVTFMDNVAVSGNGGAVELSGANTGARFENGCEFIHNSALTGSGGALSVEDSASAHIVSATAKNNSAQENGGFLFGSFAAPLLLQNVHILSSIAKEGGGGAISISSSNMALDLVNVKGSNSGSGGGALLVDKGASAHLLRTTFEDNNATSNGGHVQVAASALVIHDTDTSLAWEMKKPLNFLTTDGARKYVDRFEDCPFYNSSSKKKKWVKDCNHFFRDPMPTSLLTQATAVPSIILGSRQYRIFTSGGEWNSIGGCEDHDGWQSITSLEECREAAHLLGIKNVTSLYEKYFASKSDNRINANIQEKLLMDNHGFSEIPYLHSIKPTTDKLSDPEKHWPLVDDVNITKFEGNIFFVSLLRLPSACSAMYELDAEGSTSFVAWSQKANAMGRKKAIAKAKRLRIGIMNFDVDSKGLPSTNVEDVEDIFVPKCSKLTRCICRRQDMFGSQLRPCRVCISDLCPPNTVSIRRAKRHGQEQ